MVADAVRRDVEAVRTRVVVVRRGGADQAVTQPQGVGADAVEPRDGPVAQVTAGRLTDRRHQVVEHRVAPRVDAEVGAQPLDERVLADVGHQLLEDARALGVGDRVEVRHRLRDVGHLAADGVGRRRHVLPVAAHLAGGEEGRPLVGELGAVDPGPVRGPGRERLVEPQVVPPPHRDQVAEPHVRHLVEQDLGAHRTLAVGRGAAVEHAVGPGHRAPVLHRAAHVGHEHLVVAFLRERLAEALAEEDQAALGEVEELLRVTLEELLERLAAEEAEVVAGAGGPQLVEGPGVDDRDVRRQRRRVAEGPAAAAVVEVLDPVGRGVARHRPALVGVGHEAVGRLEVGLVEAGEGVARHVGLEGRPDVDELVVGVDGAQDRVAGRRVGLRGAHHQDVLVAEARQREAPTLGGGGVERLSVERRGDDMADAVHEGGGARFAAGEGDGRRRGPQVAVVQTAQVEVDVVPLDREEIGSLSSFVPGQAGEITHRATVAPYQRGER